MFVSKCGEHLRQACGAQLHRSSDSKRPHEFPRRPFKIRKRFRKRLKEGSNDLVEPSPFARPNEPPMLPNEQRDAEFCLELGKALTHCRLCDPDQPRGFLGASSLVHMKEDLQPVQIRKH